MVSPSQVPLRDVIAVTPVGLNRWTATPDDTTRISGGLVHGGVLLGIAGNALVAASGRPHPVSITGHYVDAVKPGELTITTEVLRQGRHCFARAKVTDAEERPVLAATAVLADLTDADGTGEVLEPFRDLPDRERLMPWPPAQIPENVPAPPEMFNLLKHEVNPASFGWAIGAPSGTALMEAMARPVVGAWDPMDVLVLADVYPPPAFNTGMTLGWTPTLELTVHLRGLPREDEPIACQFTSSLMQDGYIEEDGLLRGQDGRVIAMSRQLQLAPKNRS